MIACFKYDSNNILMVNKTKDKQAKQMHYTRYAWNKYALPTMHKCIESL